MRGLTTDNQGLLVDITALDKVVSFDRHRGLLEVESGIMWPAVIDYLKNAQRDLQTNWTIAQKQTGCDLLTMGGSLSANVHGRGLNKAPIVCDIEEFTIVIHDGSIKTCNRELDSELFTLAIGGYGLFGIIATVTLRLVSRVTLQRSVEVCSSDNAVELLEQRKSAGATYGDFQFAIDCASCDFLQIGIISTYNSVELAASALPSSSSSFGSIEPQPETAENKLLSESEWEELLYLAHTNKSKAFSVYKAHYLSTNGQIYMSDTFQLATYINGYHKKIDAKLNKICAGSEAITELYVPRTKLGAFMKRAAALLRNERANVIYGTVRLIERDDETFLAWATQPWACIIFNLHVDHDHISIQAVSNTFRSLYQLAIEFGGKYYLTYNRYAASNQLQACYPQVPRFVELKRKYDPFDRFNSDWFNYLKNSRNYF